GSACSRSPTTRTVLFWSAGTSAVTAESSSARRSCRMRGSLLLVFVATTAAADEGPPVGNQELGARVGVELNMAGVAPGGLRLDGVWLYRLTDRVWFDGRADFTIGGGGSNCSMGSCSHAVAD